MIEKQCTVGKHEPNVHHGAEFHHRQCLQTERNAYLDSILEPYDVQKCCLGNQRTSF